MYRNDPAMSRLCESLTDLDEGLQEWRYRHVMMVQRDDRDQGRHRRIVRRRVPPVHPVPARLPRPLGHPTAL